MPQTLGADSRRTVSSRYARFYPVLAVGSAAVVFLPLFEDRIEYDDNGQESFRSTFGTIFDLASDSAGAPAVAGLVLLGGLMVLLLVGSLRDVGSAAVPLGIAALGGVLVVMLATKPATGDPAPDLADGGQVGLVIAVFAVVVGLAHAVHLLRTPATSPPRLYAGPSAAPQPQYAGPPASQVSGPQPTYFPQGLASPAPYAPQGPVSPAPYAPQGPVSPAPYAPQGPAGPASR